MYNVEKLRLSKYMLPKPMLCVWLDISVHDMDQLWSCADLAETKLQLMNIFGLQDTQQGQIMADMYAGLLKFAKQNNFDQSQTSTLLTIAKRTHEINISTPFGNFDACYAYFKELVLLHTVHRPPWSLRIFDAGQVHDLSAYVINTYFRHYKMYKYAFTAKLRLDLSIQYAGMLPSELGGDGDEGEDAEQDAQRPDEETPVVPETPAPPPQEEPDTEPESDLERVIKNAITEQLKELQMNVEKQLDETDRIILDKLHALEAGSAPGSLTPTRRVKSPKGAHATGSKHRTSFGEGSVPGSLLSPHVKKGADGKKPPALAAEQPTHFAKR